MIQADRDELPSKDEVREVAKDVKILKHVMAKSNPSYSMALQVNNKAFDPRVGRQSSVERKRFFFSVNLPLNNDKTENYEETKDYLMKILKPRKNNIRVSFRIIRSGACVLEFPTAAKKSSAKTILEQTKAPDTR